MKILIVEDEPQLLDSMSSYFTKEGYICELANNYREADLKLNDYDYDCVILDLTLPDGNGLDLLKELQQRKEKTGVIILSARYSLEDRILGLRSGADDYLPKPFYMSELHARLQSLIRRIQFKGEDDISLGNIRVSLNNRHVEIGEDEVSMTGKEYELLLYFISNSGRVISKTSITEHIWGDHLDQVDSYHFLYSQIKNLKRKLLDAGADYTCKAVYSLGYKFVRI